MILPLIEQMEGVYVIKLYKAKAYCYYHGDRELQDVMKEIVRTVAAKFGGVVMVNVFEIYNEVTDIAPHITKEDKHKYAYYEEVPHNASLSYYNPDMPVTESIKVIEQQEEELREQHEQEVEREAWIAGVTDSTIPDIDFEFDFSDIESQFANVDNFDAFGDALASLESDIVVSGDSISAALSELEAFYPKDAEEDSNMCN